jgi:predicted ATPase/DNA-binding XRE family transcriptional regulator
MAESFARLLKRYRIAAGLSQEALAERAAVSVDAISYLERDVRHAPQRATLDLLIGALGLDDRARREIEEAARLARARGPQTHERPANNLPPELTSFVDREKELPEIKGHLQSHRLVTVVGTGGAGTTRSAIAVARGLMSDFGDGVWLADLSFISDPALVSAVVARALNVQEDVSRPILDTLLAYLKRKALLLILDNCEHVIEEARSVGARILNNCPDVRILATSRESFSITGELAYRIPSLPVPSEQSLSSKELSRYGAVQLFSERAVSARHSFALTAESAPHVANVCRRLDGIPLAIELAAARVNVLSPRELAQRLDERFRLLTSGDRSALPRHRTMRALIDWSYDLLSDDERRLFRGLSIFAGGFPLEACAAVCGDGARDEIKVLDLLSSLVDKSLVQVAAVGDATRYRLLESMRQYAREKLSSAGEEQARARAHAYAFLELAEDLCAIWETEADGVLYAQAEPELDNFRVALSWSFGPQGDALLGQRLTTALRRVWLLFGPAEGRRWVRSAQLCVSRDTPAATLAALDLGEAAFALTFIQPKASLEAAERALAGYRELADAPGMTSAKLRVGCARAYLGETEEAEAILGEVLDALRPLGACRAQIAVLEGLAAARFASGDLTGARQRVSEALASARVIGSERDIANMLLLLAEVEFRGGDALAALRLADEALPIFSVFHDSHHVPTVHSNMAAYLVTLGWFGEARSTAREAVTGAHDAQFPVSLTWALQHMAAVAALRPSAGAPLIEDRRRAACILGYVDSRLVALETLRLYTEQQEYDAMVQSLRYSLGEVELSRLMALGNTWSEDQAVAEAMQI